MIYLEKDLEDLIFTASDEELESRGFDINGTRLRQVNLGSYGICDILTYSVCKKSKEIDITIYELKKNNLDYQTLMQAVRYSKGVKHFFQSRKSLFKVNIKIVLVGAKADALVYFLPDVFECVSVILYDFNITGVLFKNISGYGYSATNLPKKLKFAKNG